MSKRFPRYFPAHEGVKAPVNKITPCHTHAKNDPHLDDLKAHATIDRGQEQFNVDLRACIAACRASDKVLALAMNEAEIRGAGDHLHTLIRQEAWAAKGA